MLRALRALTAVKTCDSCECCRCISDLLTDHIVKWDGGPDGWRAGSGGGQGRVAGLVGWRAGAGGGLDDRRGMDLRSKECSGVNIFT